MSTPTPDNRLPNPHPGEILRDEYLTDLGITAYRLAKETGLSQTHVSQVISGVRGVTAPVAYRLGAYFGTGPKFWLGLQQAYDLEEAATPELLAAVAAIQPHPAVIEAFNTPIPEESEEDAARRDAGGHQAREREPALAA